MESDEIQIRREKYRDVSFSSLSSGIFVYVREACVQVELGYCELQVGRKKRDMAKSLLLLPWTLAMCLAGT